MKYQEAVEKAKKERAAAVPAVAEPAGAPAPADPVAAGRAALQLESRPAAPASPTQRQSRRVAFDEEVAARNRCVCLQPDRPELEYYKVLRTQLMQRMQPMGWNTVMITSVGPGEGKSLTAINLAVVVAMAYDHTVLLVDCNLREQSVWRCMGLPGESGLVDYLADGADLKEVIIRHGIEKMSVISGGRATAESSELLGAPRMRELMAELKGRYPDRFVVIDAPPILGSADGMILTAYVDAVVVVAESGKTPFKEIQGAMELIPREKFMGFVLNKHPGAKRF